MSHAVGVYKDMILRVLVEERAAARARLMDGMVESMAHRVVPVRPGREVLRKAQSRKARFHHNHKSNC